MSSSDAESIPELTPQTIECEEELETFEDIPENDQEHVQVLEAESVDEQGNQVIQNSECAIKILNVDIMCKQDMCASNDPLGQTHELGDSQGTPNSKISLITS